ncbi:MAG: [NiFe]-hydrogenase assembly chaperone HybE [Betaproteobacteria bacterium]
MTETDGNSGVSAGAPPLPDPSPRLNAAYRAIARRMEGLNFVNPAIDVEAVAFAPWESHWLGAMVTPWCINLMLLPRDTAGWTSLPQGGKRRYAFPAGEYEFISSHDEAVGEYQMCSLISPVLDLPDHATACQVAELARAALLDPANAAVPEASSAGADHAGLPPGPLAQIRENATAPMSKRDFLRGRFLRGERAE